MSYFQLAFGRSTIILPSSHTQAHVRPPLEAKKFLSFFLHRLAHGTSTHMLSQLYRVGESTIRKYCHMLVANLICTHLLPKCIQIPTEERLIEIASDFQTLTLLPNVCGAIDGTHIKLYQKPKDVDYPAQYMCRHHFYSILLQGICDAHKSF